MTDTEKLAELLGKMVDFSDGTLYLMADYLIGKGVAIQQWVPVTEQLPEKDKLVLCIWNRVGYGHYGIASYQRDNVWYVLGEGMPKVTHWMPLPEPPKEVE